MRSLRPEARLLAAVLAAVLACGSAIAAPAALTRERVDEAARQLRDLPAMQDSKIERELRFKPEEPTPPPNAELPAWVRWLGDFIGWLNDTGRWLVWTLGAIAVALVLLRLRWFLRRDSMAGGEALALPTHVRHLDIRPETLPADVGAAALALWQAGQVLAAMSLLYRGALSRLVHEHGVPIRASSTEGDCLQLAEPCLAQPAQQYLEVLVAAWRQTVYAGREPAAEHGQWLCATFTPRLGATKVAP